MVWIFIWCCIVCYGTDPIKSTVYGNENTHSIAAGIEDWK